MTIVWGSTFFVAKVAIDAMAACPSAEGVSPDLPPVVFMLFRFVLAAVAFLLFFPWALREVNRRCARAALWMSLACVAGCLFQVVGLGRTTPSMSAFLTSLAVLFTPLWVWLWAREAPHPKLLLAVALSIGGLALLTHPEVGAGWGHGETLNLLCAMCFAVQIVMIDRFMRDLPVAGTTWVMFVLAGPMVACSVPFFDGWRALYQTPWLLEMARSRDVQWTMAYLVLVGSVLAIYIANRFQKDINPTRAAVIYTLEPVFAAVFSWAFWGKERFTSGMIAGAAILLAGNLVAELSKKKDAKLADVRVDS